MQLPNAHHNIPEIPAANGAQTMTTIKNKAGYKASKIFMLINCHEGMREKTIKKLERLKDVTEINPVDGSYDLLIKIETKTSEDLKKIINKSIRSIDSIKNTMYLKANRGIEILN